MTSVLLKRPAFDDRNLGNELKWINDNADLLARYWSAQGRALGIDDREGEEDLTFWLSEQHRQQIRHQPGFMYEEAS